MKLKLIILPILSLVCLTACSNKVPKSSSKLFTNEAYYGFDTTYGYFGEKREKEKASFMVLRNDRIFSWDYNSDTDTFRVNLIHLYMVRGDTLFKYQVYGAVSPIDSVKYGDKKVYDTLESAFEEYTSRRTDFLKNVQYSIFGELDYGIIRTSNVDIFYATYSVGKDLGYFK